MDTGLQRNKGFYACHFRTISYIGRLEHFMNI